MIKNMEDSKKINFKNLFFWLICVLPVLFFCLNWFFVFQLFSSDFSAGIYFFILALIGGSAFLLTVVFLEKEKWFSLWIFCLGNLAPFFVFSLTKRASFLGLIISFGLALLFFSSGKKHFWKETNNQIKVAPASSLKKPFKGLVFALAILFSSAFYFINFFQENHLQPETNQDEKIFGGTMETLAATWDKIFPNSDSIGGFNLNLTIDEYIQQNLPAQDRSLLGSQVQLPDGTVTIFNQNLLDQFEKSSIDTAREQLSKQFNQSLQGNEKLFQVVGMILDQRIEGVVGAVEQTWPNLSPILLVKALSFFFVFLWLGNLFRWPMGKIAQGILWFFVKKGWVKKEVRVIEKEELFFE